VPPSTRCGTHSTARWRTLRSRHQEEIEQLQATLNVQRHQLERARFDHEQALAGLQSAARSVVHELHATIEALRGALDGAAAQRHGPGARPVPAA
jgi:small-conductance mechanosensitive channel